jgi:hypothetical protein
MGVRYSLNLLTRRNECDSLLAEFSSLLDDEGQARLRQLTWSPESEVRRRTLIGTDDIDARGIAGLPLAKHEFSNSHCFSLLVQLELGLASLVGDHGLKCFGQAGSFGCLWTSIFAGEEFLLLQVTAATSGMSRVLERSEVIQDTWAELARKVRATFAYVDVEDRTAMKLYPRFGDLYLPDTETLAFVGDERFSIDRLALYLIAAMAE